MTLPPGRVGREAVSYNQRCDRRDQKDTDPLLLDSISPGGEAYVPELN
jgi:hypothetical protein